MKNNFRTAAPAPQEPLGYPVLIAVLGLLITSVGTWIAWNEIQRERAQAFDAAVERIHRAVQADLDEHLDLVGHWRDVLAAAPGLSDAQLRRVLRGQQRNSQYAGLRKYALAARVPADRKGAFERGEPGVGCNTGGETRKRAGREAVERRISIRPAGERPVYYPVCFDLEAAKTGGILGLDVGTSAAFLAAVKEQAGTPAAMATSRAMRLRRLPELDPAVLPLPALVVPVTSLDDAGINGSAGAAEVIERWVLIWIDFNTLVAAAIEPVAPAGYSASLRVPSLEASPVRAGTSHNALNHVLPGVGGTTKLSFAMSGVTFGDNPLELSVSAPSDSIRVEEEGWPLAIVLAGGALTALLATGMFSLQRSRRLAMELAQRLAGDVQEREQRFRDLVETTPDWVWETDRDGVYSYSSPSSVGLFGYAADDIVGTRGDRLWGARQVAEMRRESMTGGVRRRTAQHRSGQPVELDSSAVPILGAQGEFMGWRGFDRDVSRRVRLEEELEALQARLRGAIQSESVSHAMTGLAHEINQPLAAIAAYNQACLRLAASDPTMNPEILSAIRATSSHAMIAADIVRKFRDMSAARPIARTPVCIADIIDSAVGIVSARIDRERISMQVSIEPKVPAVMGDATLLVQVLMNLMQNAVDAVSGISAREVRVGVRMDGAERVRVEVSDNGAGIPAAARSRIFSPYYTTKADGAGMGLAICRAIIEAHGETIDVRSTSEGRTVFWFTLAAAEAAHA